MRKIELELNEENIRKTLAEDVIGRNEDIYSFLCILDSIDGNMSIAIDGDWGSGKTFFVKQTEMLLNYYRRLKFEPDSKDEDEELKTIIENNNNLKKIDLEKGFIPIYYNAWLYDDHQDPILSLMYTMIKDNNLEYITEIKSKLGKKIVTLLNAISFIKGSNIDFNTLLEDANGANFIDAIETVEDIKIKMQEVFDEIIQEHGDKLVIFIDELDRCNPQYAISVLEKIKHFFQDDRIIFVYSTNKSQLAHTTKKYYGNDFDASRYLNKFFDFSLKLGKVDINQYISKLGIEYDNSSYFYEMSLSVVNYYDFSMRDCNRYFQSIDGFEKYIKNYKGYHTYMAYWMILFVPIIFALRIYDSSRSVQFENGKLAEEVENLIMGNSNIYSNFKYFIELAKKITIIDDRSLIAEVKTIYEDLFFNTKDSKIITSQERKWFEKKINGVQF